MPNYLNVNSKPVDFINTLLKTTHLSHQGLKTIKPDENAVICLQREYTLINGTNEQKQKPLSFIGTKNLHSCIFVYLYNDKNHLSVHCDNSTDLDFLSLIKEFTSHDNLKVILIGGNDKQNNQSSMPTLKYIIRELINVAKNLKIEIEVVGQCLLGHNNFQENNKLNFFCDKFIEKADILHRYLYDKPLDMSLVTLTPEKLKQEKTLSMQEQLYVGLLNVTSAFESDNFKKALLMLPKLKTDQNYFYTSLNSLNHGAFSLLDPVYTMKDLYPDSNLSNFVIDVATKKLFLISAETTTPSEIIRQTAVILNDDRYFCAYNQSGYHLPILSNNAKKLLKKISERSTRFILEEDLKEVLAHNPAMRKYSIARYLLKYIQTYQKDIANNWQQLPDESKVSKLSESKDTLFPSAKLHALAMKEYDAGIAFYKLKNYVDAIKQIKLAINQFESNGSAKETIAIAYSALSSVYRDRNSAQDGDKELAQECLDKAFKIYKDKGYLENTPEILKLKAKQVTLEKQFNVSPNH